MSTDTIPSPKDKAENSYYKNYTFRMKAGHTYTIDLISGDKHRQKARSVPASGNPRRQADRRG